MKQLQSDRNYASYLLRLVDTEARKCSSKDELIKFINELNKSINSDSVINYVRDNQLKFDYQVYSVGVQKILEYYDRTHQTQINSSNYKQMQVDNKNYIVSNDGIVLEQNKTDNLGDLAQDFKSKQNEMVGAKTDDSLVNAQDVFSVMQNEMGQSNFMPLNKVDVNRVPHDMIMKINFLIKNPNISYNDFQVDIKRGIFINVKENELYDVRKDPNTNQFKLYKAQQAVYTQNNDVNNDQLSSQNINVDNKNNGNNVQLNVNDMAMFSDEELMAMSNNNLSDKDKEAIKNEIERRKNIEKEKNNANTKNKANNKVKKRILTKEKIMPILNNGYVSTILITSMSAISGILLAILILAKR